MKLKWAYLLLIIPLFVFIGIKLKSLKPQNSQDNITPAPVTKSQKCPSGFVLVPGNELYKTSDFCVMKYDAKCTNTDSKCVTKEGVYKNDQQGCACENGFKVTSTPNGAPIAFIPEEGNNGKNAINYCKKEGWHLITNQEWMTIARNAERVNDNWCNKDGTGCGNATGTPGKILSNGHNDSFPGKALEASNDDTPCFGTAIDGSGICGHKSSQKRTITLSNGEVVWDLAGNVWQWIDIQIQRKDEPRTIIPGLGNSRWTWGELSTVPYSNDFDPVDNNLNSSQGIGKIFHFNSQNDTDTTIYTYIRAGNWRHGNDSGIFTVHMQPVPTKTGIEDIGFRCATNPT